MAFINNLISLGFHKIKIKEVQTVTSEMNTD